MNWLSLISEWLLTFLGILAFLFVLILAGNYAAAQMRDKAEREDEDE